MGSYELKGNGTEGTVALSGAWYIQDAEALKDAFMEALERYQTLSVDFSAVDGADLTFFQVVCAVQAELKTRGLDLQAASPLPPTIEEIAENLGVMLSSIDHCFWRRE